MTVNDRGSPFRSDCHDGIEQVKVQGTIRIFESYIYRL